MMLNRQLDLVNLLNKKSFFLFGPRATGKSFLIKHQFTRETPIFNLLRTDIYLHLQKRPWDLEAMIAQYNHPGLVVIDEIQRVPELLNEVHRLIEEKQLRFLLTGSSARKLRHTHVNLLAGRAWQAELFPLTSSEIPQFDLGRNLRYGGLPPVYLSNDPHEELLAYVDTYLRQEIQAESLVRKLPAFTRFLELAALTSGAILNLTSISNDVGVAVSTIREYYAILDDTFLGFTVPPWTKSLKRKPTNTPKFYLFDLGVKNTLARITELPKASDLYGMAFEHFIALELRAWLSYRRLHQPLQFWQTQQGYEVDFIIGDKLAIEVKTTKKISDKHLKGLRLLAEENICNRYIIVSFDTVERKQGLFEIKHWRSFLQALWQDKILNL